MAKKKKRSRSRKARKSKSYRQKSAMPLGAAGGAFLTGYNILVKATDTGKQPLTYLLTSTDPMGTRLTGFVDRLAVNVMDMDRYYPLIGGAAISASPRIPVVGIVAKPINRAVRKLSKGKVSL